MRFRVNYEEMPRLLNSQRQSMQLLAALAIHSANSILDNTRIGRVNPPIRTGISYGPVISDRRMITGQAVIRAQRVEQLAKPGQVLFDQSVYDQLAPQKNLKFRKLGSERLKGFGQPTTIYQAVSTAGWSVSAMSAHFQALACQNRP